MVEYIVVCPPDPDIKQKNPRGHEYQTTVKGDTFYQVVEMMISLGYTL
jgi:predicted transcriptional regulator